MVYVDKIFDTSPYKNAPRCMRNGACHMWADTSDELFSMARRIGLKLEWVQNSGLDFMHFDLTPKKRAAALCAGAKEVSLKEHRRKILIERGLIPKNESDPR
jgi:hypothetical protein